MKNLDQNPFLDGSVMSEELTSIQKQIGVYVDYINKLARTRSEQQTALKLERPDGQETFSKALELEEGKKGKKLTDRERKKLEKSTKFTLKVAKMGNATQIYNSVFHEVTAENKHWQQLIDSAKKEIERLCTQAGAIEKLQKYDERDHL